ncbi:MAG: trehalose-phosphatase [Aeromicrobium sp.]
MTASSREAASREAAHRAAVTRAAVVADPAGTLLALDFDGTLSHIVDDPTRAFAHADSVEALGRLGAVLGQVAIITGRPVRQALDLSGFEGHAGLERLVILGQYGAERWDAADGRTSEPARPEAVAALASTLPAWLAERGAQDVRIEDKGLAIALHTRGIDPGLLDELRGPVEQLAADLGLAVEPGRQVIELRGRGHDKGDALLALVADSGARQVVFGGDDLGDLPAFAAVEQLRSQGVGGLLLCSASAEQDALVSRADIVLDGPDAVASWLQGLADELVPA